MTDVGTHTTRRERDHICQRPELQPMILRLGLAIGDINAKGITRTDIAATVAATVAARRAAQ